MFVQDSDNFVDIYPFVESASELPSARVTLSRQSNKVSYQGDWYTREDFQKLTEAFEKAFEMAEKYQ